MDELTNLTERKNVHVLLVAHPPKNSSSSVSGSSMIDNLATTILEINKTSLTIKKNRIGGKEEEMNLICQQGKYMQIVKK